MSSSRCTDIGSPLILDADADNMLRERILKRLRAAILAASACLLGSSPHLWKLLVREDETKTTDFVIDLFIRVALGQVGLAIRSSLVQSDLSAGPRGDDRVRTIEVPSFVRKVAMAALMDVPG